MDDKGLSAWEMNAEFWDKQMGDASNFFHRDIVRPGVERLLALTPQDLVLDIACGNGNFSAHMAEQGVSVLAVDYSSNMIALAQKRRAGVLDKVVFQVCDCCEYAQLVSLKRERLFTKAVCNMGIMDMADVAPMFRALSELLEVGGRFVFATHHPCFTYPNKDYFKPEMHKGVAIEGQPVVHNYYHRSLQDILAMAFTNDFCLDGMEEVPFHNEQTPIIIIARLIKMS